jgi:tetratricopeptide (TPR) repeat protein
MSDVFISYANEDRERAGNLAKALQDLGWSVWWDRKIIAGQSFDQEIERELENANCVVVLWSENSVSSEWVKNEAADAVERAVLVPAMIDRVKLPLEFRRKQTADLVGWHGEASHAGFKALGDGITATIGGKVPPRPAPAPVSEPRKKPRWLWVATAVAAVAIGLGAYLALSENKTASKPNTHVRTTSYRNDIYNQLNKAQREAVKTLGQDKSAAIRLIDKNLMDIETALKSFPEDAAFYSLRGYAAKDVYQSSKNLLPAEKRREYLAIARKSFENALRLSPKSAAAHNGMGNVYFFEGKFDEALKQHNVALQLMDGEYPAAEHDKRLVQRIKNGEIPFNF